MSGLLQSSLSNDSSIMSPPPPSTLLVSPLPPSLLCPICHDLVCSPLECQECQTVFCSECLKIWLTKKDQCPFDCPKPFKVNKAHKLVRQNLAELLYRCENKKCDLQIKREDWDRHSAECGWKQIICRFSSDCVAFIKKDLALHEQKCPSRPITCSKCKFSFPFSSSSTHDCISMLSSKYQELCTMFADYKLENDKIVNQLLLQIGELKEKKEGRGSEVEKQKPNQKKGKHFYHCKQGHDLVWNDGDYLQCGACNENSVFCRFECRKCKIGYCHTCMQPWLGEKECPQGHEIEKRGAYFNHSCDLCRKSLNEEKIVYTDRVCDFDVCNNCFIKNS